MSEILDLTLFGGFSAAVSGQALTKFRTDKMRALLAYLAVNEERPYRRDLLATLLWPEWSDVDARRNLRQTLHRLSQLLDKTADSLGKVLFTANRQTVQLNHSAVQVDVLQFQEHLRAIEEHSHLILYQCDECLKRMQQAAALYQGDLLGGFFVRDAAPFEEWLSMQREQLQQRYLALLAKLAWVFEKQGASAYLKAERYAKQHVALAPWRETAHRQLMRLYMLQGKPTEALAQYKVCRQVLAEELGVEPSPDTVALWRGIKDGEFQSIDGGGTADPQIADIVGFPTQLTPFVGRQQDISEIMTALADENCRLLTLLGPGGIGKTRLSIKVGQSLGNDTGRYKDGAYFIPLVAVTGESMLITTIAQHLGQRLTGPAKPRQQLLSYLRDKKMLLVCDNFEQVVEGAGLLGEIVAEAPGVQLLVTSRLPLSIQAEWRYAIQGLDYEQGEDSEAVRFFKRNAQRISPHLNFDGRNLTAVLDLCRLVEGMPLALEIAAAWTRLMDIPTILRETQKSLAFLTSPLEDLPDRHRSIEAVMTQSWGMLPGRLQSMLGQMALFNGNFTLDAALVVIDNLSLLDVAKLLDRSLLRWRPNGRYQMHELLRQFVSKQLVDEPASFREKFSRYYLTFIAGQEDRLVGEEPRKAIESIQAEIGNVRQAWQWAVADGATGLIAKSLNGMLAYYEFRGSYEEGRELFAAAAEALSDSVLKNRLRLAEASCRQRLGDLAAAAELVEAVIQSEEPETKLAAIIAQADLDEQRSEYETAIQLLEQALTLAGEYSAEAAEIWTILGSIYGYRGPLEKRIAAHKRALAINVILEDRLQTAECHTMLSMIYKDLGEYEEAIEHIERALAIAREMNHRESIGRFTQKFGLIYWRMDDLEKAKDCYEQALAIATEISHKRLISICSGSLGVLAKRRRDYELALRYYRRAVQLAKEVDDKSIQAVYLGNIGNAYMDLGRYERAIDHLKEAAELDRELGAMGGVARHQGNIGDAFRLQGRYEEALPYFEAAIEPLRETGANYFLCWVLVSYAECLFEVGRMAEAEAVNEEGGRLAAEIGREYYEFSSELLKIRMRAAAGSLVDVEDSFNGLRQRFTTLEMQANIDDVWWQITGDTAVRKKAAAQFKQLFEETNRERYRTRSQHLESGP